MMSAKEKYDLCETTVRILDGSISEDEFRLFEKKLAESAEVRSIYMGVLEAYGYMKKSGHSLRVNTMGREDDSCLRPDLWKSLARAEKEAPAIEIKPDSKEPELIQNVQREKVLHPLKLSTLAPVIAAVAAILLMIIFVRYAPVRGISHGQVIDTYQAVFNESISDMRPGGFLGEELIELQKGLVRLQMNDGSMMLVEAPAEFRLEEDDQVFLVQGKLTADVPKSGIGFTVRTPSASVVDYGTEFAVSVDQYAKTEAHVLKGKVEMRLGSNPRVFDNSIRLSANQAAAVSGQDLMAIPAKVDQFVYETPSPFEINAKSLNPVLHFRLKGNNVHTFCNVTGKSDVEVTMGPNLKITSSPYFGQDQSGYALQMKGPEGIQIQNILPIFASESGNFTEVCWVRFNRIEKQVVMSNRAINPSVKNHQGYYRVLWINEKGNLEHSAYFPQHSPSDRIVNPISSAETLKPNQWYFVAVTHAKGDFKALYLDGKRVAQSSRYQDIDLEKYNDLTFGRSMDDLAPGLTGALSDVLFFDRSLTDEEIQSLYESALKK